MRILGRWSGRLAVAAAVAMTASLARAQVMEQVPDSAMVVVKVANLTKTSQKVASLSQKMGLAQLLPQLQDPLAALKQKLHDPKGLNPDGDLAFVYVNPDTVGGDKEKSMMVLIPVTDYQAFLGNLQGVKTDGEVSEGTFPDTPETSYVTHWGNYAVVSPAKETIAKKPEKGLAIQGVTAKEVGEKDLVVYANFAQIRSVVLPELQKNRQKIISEFEKKMAEARQRQRAAAGGDAAATAPQEQQSAAALKAMMNQGLNLAEQFLRDARAATWGINLADDGIKGSLVAEFEPNSYFGQFAAGAKNTDQSFLTGLPSNSYLAFGGLKNDPQRMTKLVDDIGTPIIKDLKSSGMDTTGLEQYVASIKQYFEANRVVKMGIVAPGGALGQEAMFQSVALIEGTADQIAAAMREMPKSQETVAKLMGQPEGQTKMTFTPNAKTVEGVTFDRVQTQITIPANNPQAAQAQQMVTLMYGPDGMNMYSGKVDDKHVVMVSGGSDELIAKAVKAAKSNDDALEKLEQLKIVNAQLPPTRLGVLYVPIDNLVTTGVNYAKQFGMPIQVQLPPNLPPIGAALSAEGTAYRVDGFLPAPLVQSLVSAGMQAFMAMQGGGAQPGGPGGL